MATIRDEDIKEQVYRKGRRIGTIIGATITLLIMSFAYIVSQGIMYWK